MGTTGTYFIFVLDSTMGMKPTKPSAGNTETPKLVAVRTTAASSAAATSSASVPSSAVAASSASAGSLTPAAFSTSAAS